MRTIFTILLAMILAGAAMALEAEVTAVCEGDAVRVNVLIPTDDLPPEGWVGYILVRNSYGLCTDEVVLTPEPVSFGEDLELLDTPDIVELTYSYVAYGLDEEGQRHVIGMFLEYEWAAVNCAGGPVNRGRLEDWGWTLYLDVCEGMCWAGGFLENYPAWLDDYAGTDTVFDIYGTLEYNFEGPYVLVTDALISECDAVSVQSVSWSAVKALHDNR